MVPGWRPTAALLTVLATIALALVLAVTLRRADLVVVAAPLVAGTLAALRSGARPAAGDDLVIHSPAGSVWEGDLAEVTVAVTVDRGTGPVIDLALVGVEHGAGLRAEGASTARCVALDADGRGEMELTLRATRWGRAMIGPATLTLTAAHGLLRADGRARRTTTVAVVPSRAPFDAIDAVPDAAGQAGSHLSRRPGSGADLLAVRLFVAGDRLRRITWPVSLRTGQLHVTTTASDRDTDVWLVVDAGVEVGVEVGSTTGSHPGSSLDLTVRAAASVAEHYLRRGDRVGLIDLGSPRPVVRLGTGRRHLLRLLSSLLSSTATATADADRVTRQLHQLSTRSLVLVFSTLLDERVTRHLAQLARRGHSLLVVDTLPPGARPERRNEWTASAWRLTLLGRENLTGRLAELGVPVVTWRGAGSLDLVLRRLARAAVAPRRAR